MAQCLKSFPSYPPPLFYFGHSHVPSTSCQLKSLGLCLHQALGSLLWPFVLGQCSLTFTLCPYQPAGRLTRPKSPRSSLPSPPLRVGRPPRVAQAPTWPRNMTLGAPTLDTLDIQISHVSVSLASSIHPESRWLKLLLRASSPHFLCPGSSKQTRQQKPRQGQHLLSVG